MQIPRVSESGSHNHLKEGPPFQALRVAEPEPRAPRPSDHSVLHSSLRPEVAGQPALTRTLGQHLPQQPLATVLPQDSPGALLTCSSYLLLSPYPNCAREDPRRYSEVTVVEVPSEVGSRVSSRANVTAAQHHRNPTRHPTDLQPRCVSPLRLAQGLQAQPGHFQNCRVKRHVPR